jgi:D-tagatose-1,6-bisphosphate aldolase subunit GatZ/KbaZ
MSRLAAHLGARRGIPSWCTAHPETLTAILASYRDDDAPILIEATCNQVNQTGGYTGMTPADFVLFVSRLARKAQVDSARLILGGDHLGPNPWKAEPAAQAMAKARAMVKAYVAAGFEKIHLDASMACADDGVLAEEVMAARAADLCAVAEASGRPLAYVIGTEVPVPGGETMRLDTLAVTRPDAVRRTLDLHRAAFAARGLSGAFDRVIGVVTQPGVDFGNDHVYPFDFAKAADLSALLPGLPTFEAHSTDYQTGAALAALVAGHFRILKVGPELTFAFRQAAFALERIEAALEVAEPSCLTATLQAAMHAAPAQWRDHVAPGPREAEEMLYGLSDRVRYYWRAPPVREAWDRLCANLRAADLAPGIVAQALGALVEPGDPATLPERAVQRMVGQVVTRYRTATGG